MRRYFSAWAGSAGIAAIVAALLPAGAAHAEGTDPGGTGPATIRVSVSSDGTPDGVWGVDLPKVSANGRYVAFGSISTRLVPGKTTYNSDIYTHDVQTGVTSRVSVASDGTPSNGGSSWPSISADGRYVAFESRARNLVAGDPQDWYEDVFVHDLQTGATTRVSRPQVDDGFADNHISYPVISADGRFVSYSTDSPTQVTGDTNRTDDVLVYDRAAGTTTR